MLFDWLVLRMDAIAGMYKRSAKADVQQYDKKRSYNRCNIVTVAKIVQNTHSVGTVDSLV